MDKYKTVLNNAVWEFTERKSRFICSIKRVYSEEEAQKFIKEVSAVHKTATHNVYAYIIGGGVVLQRASDDGEPQGTAGIPVLEVLKKEGLINVCVIVTRYFGGILLGAGGLIRAYSAAARGGILEAEICTMAIYYKISVDISYNYLGKVKNILGNMGISILSVEYTENVKLYLKAPYDKVQSTIDIIKEITNGESKSEVIEKFYDVENAPSI